MVSSAEPITGTFASALQDTRNTLVHTCRPEAGVLAFAHSVAAGMAARPRRLECRFLYDAEGSRLYDAITAQPEYYPTRTEAAILDLHAADIARHTGPVTLVELGAGTSVKTDHLLRAYLGLEPEVTYVPIDVSRSALEHGMDRITRHRPSVQVVGINGTYEDAFPLLATAAPNLLVFLGSTLGNLDEEEFDAFWRGVRDHLAAGDFVLLGVDLVKNVAILEAAYNDAAGVTAQFTCNLFARMNRELDAGLDLGHIHHDARWNPSQERMEIDARFSAAQTLRVAPLERRFEVTTGERVRVEISRKFRLGPLSERLRGFGLRTLQIMTDPREWFGLLLLERTDAP